MARVIINQYGDKTYYDDEGEIHRDDGPAIIFTNGSTFHYIHGKFANSYLMEPDFNNDGARHWYIAEDEYHSINRPAVDFPTGLKKWFDEGERIWPVLK